VALTKRPAKRPLGLVLIVAFKLVWGALEVAAGLLVTSAPALLAKLADDPEDQLAHWLLAHAPMQPEQLRAANVGLLALGLLKIALAVGIWFRSWLVRDLALVVFGIAGLFALAALAAHFSPFRLLLVATDLLIVLCLWRLLPRHLPPRPLRAARGAGATLAP
jgi:uncharacterized membrane protein (DUF2068 family)